MNKVLNVIKILFFMIIIFLNVKYLIFYKIQDINIILYLVILFIVLVIDAKDLIKHQSVNKTYSILFIFVELVISMIFIRTLYDPSFIINSGYEIKNLVDNTPVYGNLTQEQLINYSYLYQNYWLFISMLLLLITYHIINFKKNKVKNL